MSEIRILSHGQIGRIFTLDHALAAVEQAYRSKQTGAGAIWPMVFHEFVHGVADLDIKSGNLEEAFGLKLVSWYGENPARGLPALHGTILLCDKQTGAPRALLNAGAVTELRTGAAGAVGAKYLARPDSRTLVLAGCGGLAPAVIGACLRALPGLERVILTNPRRPAGAAEKLAAVTEEADRLLAACGAVRTAALEAAEDVEAAIRQADILVTATPAYAPLFPADWVRPGTHISCLGADLPGKQELDPALLARAAVYGDDSAQCLAVGECQLAHKAGLLPALAGELGAVLTGEAPGRAGPEQITVFDSTGIALQDLASAAAILQAAEQQNIGTLAAL